MGCAMNVYEVITDRILASLAKGVVPWRRPWASEGPRSLISGKEYRGVNVLLLQSAGFTSPHWLTFKQARDRKGSVKAGEHGTPIVFWKISDRSDEKTANGKPKKSFILRYSNVFNVSQCEGITAPPSLVRPPFETIDACERIVEGFANRPSIDHGGDRACYSPSEDRVRMPARECFESAPTYFSVLFHELTHGTGHASRLDREGITDPIKFGSHNYSFEELIAECGAAFLCGAAGIAPATIDNSAAYIASWVAKLKSEKR